MALFGSDWLDNYDPMKEYEMNILHREDDKEDNYKPIGLHLDEDYDSMKEYEQKLH